MFQIYLVYLNNRSFAMRIGISVKILTKRYIERYIERKLKCDFVDLYSRLDFDIVIIFQSTSHCI